MLAIVADRWDAALGGRERYAEELAEYLTSQGHSVSRCVRDDDLRGYARVLALTPAPQATHYQLHAGLLESAFAAERASMQQWIRRALYYPALRANRRRQRLLDDEVLLVTGGAALMTFSASDVDELVLRYCVARTRIHLSRPGVDLARFHPPAQPDHAREGALRLAFVGNNFQLKGLAAAIEAVARARSIGLDVSLCVAGRGDAAKYGRLAAKLGAADRVHFRGPLSQAAVADLYRASDALIHPTYYDPFPRVAIEALACACPVITTRCCGASEILTNGVDGFIVSGPENHGQLLDALVNLNQRANLTRMRERAAALGRRFDARAHFQAVADWLFDGHTAQ